MALASWAKLVLWESFGLLFVSSMANSGDGSVKIQNFLYENDSSLIAILPLAFLVESQRHTPPDSITATEDGIAREVISRPFLQTLRRRKRKVISRGGHYIIRSKIGGGSPWGSPRETYNSDTFRKEQRTRTSHSGGWNTQGGIQIPRQDEVSLTGGGQSPYSSGTARRINVLTKKRQPRKKISRSLKHEIAQYALRYGPLKTSVRYERDVGRRLRERVIRKFARRYTQRVERRRGHRKRGAGTA